MVEIGAGGGSIAGVDRLQRITVGPESAGSEPGPACYGRGGEHATVTDADVVLGRIVPEHFAGGTFSLDAEAACQAVQARVADPQSMALEFAAYGVSEVVDENMAAAARAHAVEWGTDVASRTLVAYGGAAPLHATALANKLKIDRVVVPGGAGVGSAIGFLLAPVSYEVVRSRYMRLSRLDAQAANAVMDEMRAEAEAVVAAAAPSGERQESRRAFMRYVGQGYEIAVPVPVETLAERHADVLREAFDAAYQRLYGRLIPGLDVEILSWTLTLTLIAGDQAGDHAGHQARDQAGSAGMDRIAAAGRSREVDAARRVGLFDPETGQAEDAGLFIRDALAPGDTFSGPALVVEEQTTTVVSGDFDARVDDRGTLILQRRGAEHGQ
jgi:N-methylhydantoinase A